MKEIKQQIFDKIEEYKRIIISCHIRPDGDAIGSTKGLKEILSLSFPDKEIYLINPERSDYLAFLGADNDCIEDEKYQDALGIVLDTATIDRVSNQKITLCREIIKIDHHIDVKPYGDYCWIEEDASSLCEMIVDFYCTFADRLRLNTFGATCLFVGMVTDSGRFKYSPSGNTMRLAGVLLDQGIDTETIYAHLEMEEYDYYKFEAYVYKNMRITDNGVVYIHVTRAMQKRFDLSKEEASNVVSLLGGIKHCLVWIAFIDNADKTVRVRLRSRFLPINALAEKYNGGGHANASGATLTSRQDIGAVVADADAYLAEYKQNNTGWL